MIRIMDVFLSLVLLVLLLPLVSIIFILIGMMDGQWPIFSQQRVGQHQKLFKLYKFKTMRSTPGQHRITVGDRDSRITPLGYYLRKYKLDELPQLFNVLCGTMSMVGPRPEVKEYVDLYTDKQKQILQIRPGITDYASIEFSNESALLAKKSDPLQYYIDEIMPAKIELNKQFISNYGLKSYFKVLYLTFIKVFFEKKSI